MLTVSKVDVWAATCEDNPGGLQAKLEGLAKAGCDLDFVISRRLHREPGKGVVFVTPLRNERETAAAEALGFRKSTQAFSIRVEGPDTPGVSYLIMRALTAEKINVRGVSAATLGSQFVMFLAFDSAADAERAIARLARPL